jgi:hypothetical protein
VHEGSIPGTIVFTGATLFARQALRFSIAVYTLAKEAEIHPLVPCHMSF